MKKGGVVESGEGGIITGCFATSKTNKNAEAIEVIQERIELHQVELEDREPEMLRYQSLENRIKVMQESLKQLENNETN